MNDHHYQLVTESQNAKLVNAKHRKACGKPIPRLYVVNSSRSTCPPSCPNRGDCYAEGAHNAKNWTAIDTGERGTADWDTVLDFVRKLPANGLGRYGVQGDLPGSNDRLDHDRCIELAQAAATSGATVWCYTHYPVTHGPHAGHNANTIRAMRAYGMRVNCSADSPEHAQQVTEVRCAPVAVTLPPETPRISRLRHGATVKACPAQLADLMDLPPVDCAQCRLCLRDRDSVVGLYAHGRGAKSVAERSRKGTV